MKHNRLWHKFVYRIMLSLLVVLVGVGFALAAWGEREMPSQARLSLLLDPRGSVTSVQFQVNGLPEEASPIPNALLIDSVSKAVGCPVQIRQILNDDGLWLVEGTCDRAYSREGLLVRGRIDVTAIAERLQSIDQRVLSLQIQFPPSGYIQANSPYLHQWNGQNRYVYEIPVSDPALSPLPFTFGYRAADLVRTTLSLLLILLIPIWLVLQMRRGTLKNQHRNPTTAWFGYMRMLGWVSLGTLISWLFAVNSLGIWHLVEFFGAIKPTSVTRFAIELAIWFFPPLPVLMLCNALSHPIYARVRGIEWTPLDLAWQAFLANAASLIPVYCLAVGGFGLVFQPAAGVGWLVGAFVTRLVLAPMLAKAMDLTPHALTMGELRDRVFGLAELAGVKLQQLYVLPAGKGRLANAFARQGNSILLTDYLLKNLSKPEVDAVIAHELGHLRKKHPDRLATLMILGLVGAIFLGVFLTILLEKLTSWEPPIHLVLTLSILSFYLVFYFTSRRFEHEADAEAVALVNNPEAMITGLVKLMHLNQMPLQWGKWEERFLTHPSTVRRAEAIATTHHIPAERLQVILKTLPGEETHYSLPREMTEEGPLFSTTFKSNTILILSLVLLGVSVLTPALVAGLIQQTGWEGTLQHLAYWIGLGLTPTLYLATVGLLATSGFGGLRRRLGQRLRNQGMDPTSLGGIFVGLTPERAPRYYEGFSNWDVGFLGFTQDRLIYLGEQARFALAPDQITEIQLVRGLPGWWRMPRLCIQWHDRQQGTAGSFTLHPAHVPTLWQYDSAMKILHQQVQHWWQQAETFAPTPPEVAGLTAPELGAVTSVSPQEIAALNRFLNGLAPLALLAIAAGISFQLTASQTGYVLLVAMFNSIFQLIPSWGYREPEKPRG